jgi:hypothetical protein
MTIFIHICRVGTERTNVTCNTISVRVLTAVTAGRTVDAFYRHMNRALVVFANISSLTGHDQPRTSFCYLREVVIHGFERSEKKLAAQLGRNVARRALLHASAVCVHTYVPPVYSRMHHLL